jgi:hypothetical protein
VRRCEDLKTMAFGSSSTQFFPAEYVVRLNSDEIANVQEILAEKPPAVKPTPPTFKESLLGTAEVEKRNEKGTPISVLVTYVLTGDNLNLISDVTLVGNSDALEIVPPPDKPDTHFSATKDTIRVRLRAKSNQLIQLQAQVPLAAFGGTGGSVQIPFPAIQFTMPSQ